MVALHAEVEGGNTVPVVLGEDAHLVEEVLHRVNAVDQRQAEGGVVSVAGWERCAPAPVAEDG